MRARPGLADQVDWRLYYITDTAQSGGHERVPFFVEAAVRGGAGVVQVRDKDCSDDEFLALARACQAAVERAADATGRQAALVVNDRLDVAAELGLHFHQGQSDGPVAWAREKLGADVLIGLSISNRHELDTELADPTADVLGLGPVWATPTKTDASPALGVDGLADLVQRTGTAAITVAIGGINRSNASQVWATGVNGICVVSAITGADDPTAAAAELLSHKLHNSPLV